MTLKALAERAGVSYVTITRIEQRHLSPTVSTLEKLAAALGISVRELFPAKRPPRGRRRRASRWRTGGTT
jgi:transcriptional regulator with XRE-family HTH domain